MRSNFAKKSLGQNFLTSVLIRDKILEEAGDLTDKNVLEIGPGLGFLTTKLIESQAHVTAIELDSRAVRILQNDFVNKPNLNLIEGDILTTDIDRLFEQKKYSVVANIPYNITAPIFRKFLSKVENQPEMMLLMVQKEVGQKVCPLVEGKINKKFKRSILSVSVEIFAMAEICFFVPREHFDPVPKVDSAIIKLTLREKPLVSKDLETDFFTVVNAGFSQKRKKLGNVLGKFFGMPVKDLLGNIDQNRRAETLDIDEWMQVTENFRRFK